jgi:Amidase
MQHGYEAQAFYPNNMIYGCTAGYASWIGRISKEDSVLTKILKDAGAVLYVKTNIPQTLMSPEVSVSVFCLNIGKLLVLQDASDKQYAGLLVHDLDCVG